MICPICLLDAAHFAFTKKEVQYNECSDCGSIYVEGGLPNDNMVGGGFELERNTLQNDIRINRYHNLVGVAGRMLDFGAGHGMLVQDARSKGLLMWGYDKYNPEFEKIPEMKFNLISMVEVIEHLCTPYEELDMIRDLLADNGVVYVETSFTNCWQPPFEEVTYIEPTVGHATIFSHKGLDTLMKRKGLEPTLHINENVRIFIKQ